MTIRIVTDSTSDLPKPIAEQFGIAVIPCFINIGEQGFLDGVNLSRQEFYEKLPALNPLPKTAAPSIGMFQETYQRLIAEGATEILSIHLAASLSAVMNVATIAAQETTNAQVTAFDSRQLSLGTGFQAITAARLSSQGASIAEIIAVLNDQVLRTHTLAVLDTLENLRRSGRVSRLVAELGSILQVKPVMHVYNSEVNAERIRTRKAAMEKMIGILQSFGRLEQIAIVHTHSPDRAEEFKNQMQNLYRYLSIEICEEVTPVIGTHLGRDTVGIICVATKNNGVAGEKNSIGRGGDTSF